MAQDVAYSVLHTVYDPSSNRLIWIIFDLNLWFEHNANKGAPLKLIFNIVIWINLINLLQENYPLHLDFWS